MNINFLTEKNTIFSNLWFKSGSVLKNGVIDEVDQVPSTRPSRFDTPTIEWLIEEMERYAPKENSLNRTIERVNPECTPCTTQPNDTPYNNINQSRTPAAKGPQKVDDLDEEQEYGK